MKHALLIHLDPDATAGWWLATDQFGNGIGAPQHSVLADIARAAPDRRVTVLIPTERCVVLEVRAPVRDRAQLLRALPALIEERIATDVDAMHLSAGPVGADGTLRVVAIERHGLTELLGKLAAAGLAPEALLPDALCLPEGDDTVAACGDRLLLRTAQRAAAVAPGLAPLLLDGAPLSARFRVLGGPDDETALRPVREALAARGVVVADEPLARHEVERLLLRGSRSAAAFDLLHGRFRVRGSASGALKAWRVPLLLVAVWAATAAASSLLEVTVLWRERRALDAELAQLLPTAAPEAVGQPDPLFLLKRHTERRAGGAGGASLDDVVRAAGALRAVGGTELMLVDARPGSLELGVRAADLAALDAARGAVASAIGRGVELHGATSNGGRAEARLVVAQGGPP